MSSGGAGRKVSSDTVLKHRHVPACRLLVALERSFLGRVLLLPDCICFLP